MRSSYPFIEQWQARRTKVRRALTLLELIFVVAILGIFAAMAVTRLDHDLLGNTGAHGFARKLALDLLQAQRRAISTGDNHYVQFQSSGGTVSDYRLMRRGTGGDSTAVDAPRAVPNDVVATPSHMICEYAFEGAALASYSITVVGPDRSWQVEVAMATGAVSVNERSSGGGPPPPPPPPPPASPF